jgi:hypothetical protein
MFRRAVFHNCQLFANLFFLHGFVSFASDDLLKQEAGQKTYSSKYNIFFFLLRLAKILAVEEWHYFPAKNGWWG